MNDPQILLTNDDGIDAPGLAALYEALSTIGSVTVVAPADDQSAIGRVRSQSVTVHDHEWGYVLEGTPVDCVIGGLRSLVPETDLVVAGCNRGANLGTGVLGRSGTVSAAAESSFLGTPGIATSMYIPEEFFADDDAMVGKSEYEAAANAAAYLADRAGETEIFETADYLNINAPLASRSSGTMLVTQPSDVYRMDAVRDGDSLAIHNRIWELMETSDLPDPAGTDRRTVANDDISVSAITTSQATEAAKTLSKLAANYREDF